MTGDMAAALERIERGAGTPTDLAALRGLIASVGAVIGAVSVGGSADGASIRTDVHIGDQTITVPLTPEVIEALRKPPADPRLFDLPIPPKDFVGRVAEEGQLLEALSRGADGVTIAGLRGVGGIGKTALAARVARLLALHFPEAQFAIDLKGTSDLPLTPRAVMEEVIRRFDPVARLSDDEAAVHGHYRALLAGKRALIVLDNARDAAQVAPLVPPPPSAAIVTARTAITLPGGAPPIRLDNLARDQAITLLRTLLGPHQILVEALDGLATACVDHPLALTVAAAALGARWQEYSVADYTAEVLANRDRLRLDGVTDHDVMASLDLSLRSLTAEDPGLAERWRDLSVLVGSFDAEQAAVIAGLNDSHAGTAMVRRLADLGFLEPTSEPGRYRLHDLLRDLARRDQADERFLEPHDRHARVFLGALGTAEERYLQGGAENANAALKAFDRDRRDIEAGRHWAVARLQSGGDHGLTSRYASGLGYVASLRIYPYEQIVWLEDGLASARAGNDLDGEAKALGYLGNAHDELGNQHKAIVFYEAQLTIVRKIGDRRGEGATLGNLGLAHANLGNPRKAIDFYVANLAIARDINDRWGEGAALGNLGNANADLGDLHRAIELHEAHLKIAREIGDRRGEGNALGNLGLAHASLGDPRRAIDFHQANLIIASELGDRRGEGNALGNLGAAHFDLGELDKAIEFHQGSLTIAREIANRRGEGTALSNLGVVFRRLGENNKARDAWKGALHIYEEIESSHAESMHQWLKDLGNA